MDLVEFTGLTALPWIEETAMGRGRISWSFRAESMIAPGQSATSGQQGQAKGAV